MDSLQLQRLAIPGVISLVSFLAYSSQYLFHSLEPGPLHGWDSITFNALVASLLICYLRTCFTEPGRIPHNWTEIVKDEGADKVVQNARFCRKCQQPKPPRAHHCKTCQGCIPRMDHHCVWTANCISHLTYPHFVRFLFFAVAAMLQLEYFLLLRCAVIWNNRHLPSYLGPSVAQFIHLFVLVVTNSLVLFALSLLLGKTLWGLAMNVTTIESWEIERHHALVRRARTLGGSLPAPDGSEVRIVKQEFPWDIGIFSNICQGMNTWNIIAWFWPFAATPRLASGLSFKHNEIEDPSKPWPPPDPDRMFRTTRDPPAGDGFTQPMDKASFQARQMADQQRFYNGEQVVRRRPFVERYQHLAKSDSTHADQESAIEDTSSGDDGDHDDQAHDDSNHREGEEAWRTREGERLADFGVDEDVEFYDEDDLPLSELIQRRRDAAT